MTRYKTHFESDVLPDPKQTKNHDCRAASKQEMRKEQGPQHKLYPSGKSKIATQRHISTHINPSVPKK